MGGGEREGDGEEEGWSERRWRRRLASPLNRSLSAAPEQLSGRRPSLQQSSPEGRAKGAAAESTCQESSSTAAAELAQPHRRELRLQQPGGATAALR